MGCPICMEDINDFDDNDQRPTAFPCGHITHLECATRAITAVPLNKGSCPTCREPATLETLLQLYTTSTQDLAVVSTSNVIDTDDAYLASAFNSEQQVELIAELKRFEELVRLYILSVKNLGVETIERAGRKVYRLLNGHGADKALGEANLRRAVGALETAASLLSARHDELGVEQRALNRLRRDNKRITKELEVREKDLAKREKEYDRSYAGVQELRRELKEEKKRLDETLSNCNTTVHDSEATSKRVREEMTALRMRTSRQIRQVEEETTQRVSAAEMRADVAETKMESAEQDREAALSKSATLADQLRSVLHQLEEAKSRKKTWKEKAQNEESLRMVAEADNLKLKTRLALLAQQGNATPAQGRHSGNSTTGERTTTARGSNDSSSSFFSAKRKRDSDVTADQAQKRDNDSSRLQSSPASSSHVLSDPAGEESLVVDVSQAMGLIDDDAFPMPGARRNIRPIGQLGAALTSRATWKPSDQPRAALSAAKRIQKSTDKGKGTEIDKKSEASAVPDKKRAVTRVPHDLFGDNQGQQRVEALRSPSPSRAPTVMQSPHSPLSHRRHRTPSGFDFGFGMLSDGEGDSEAPPPAQQERAAMQAPLPRIRLFEKSISAPGVQYGRNTVARGENDGRPSLSLVARALGTDSSAALGPKRRPKV